MWCWRFLRVLDSWTARRSNQSINPEYSLERLMLKLKLQYFGHLMLGKIEGKRRRGQQRMRWLGSITNTITIKFVDMNWSKLGETVENRGAEEPGLLWFMGLHRVWYDSANEQQQHQYSHPQGTHPLVISHHPKPLPPPIHIYPTNACSILYPQALTTIISAKKKKKSLFSRESFCPWSPSELGCHRMRDLASARNQLSWSKVWIQFPFGGWRMTYILPEDILQVCKEYVLLPFLSLPKPFLCSLFV